jgi:hypothetical protein
MQEPREPQRQHSKRTCGEPVCSPAVPRKLTSCDVSTGCPFDLASRRWFCEQSALSEGSNELSPDARFTVLSVCSSCKQHSLWFSGSASWSLPLCASNESRGIALFPRLKSVLHPIDPNPCLSQRIDFMVRPERFELPTLWFEAKCSIQLSYGRTPRTDSIRLIILERHFYCDSTTHIPGPATPPKAEPEPAEQCLRVGGSWRRSQ